MAQKMKFITYIVSVLCVMFWLFAHIFLSEIWMPLAITFTTISYHLWMRLIVGYLFDKFMGNHVDYTNAWFQVGKNENKIYHILKVKKWKNRMPSYDPDVFSTEKHSWDEIAQAMCQAELVHETIALLSLFPILWTLWWRTFAVFFVTSVAAAFIDLLFVMMQRYNRPRVLKLAKRRTYQLPLE